MTIEQPDNGETHEDIMKWNVGLMFKELRLERGITQEAASKLMGSNKARVSNLENGRVDMKLTTLVRYARGLDQGLSFSLFPLSGPVPNLVDLKPGQVVVDQGYLDALRAETNAR